jgi:predicted nuclease with TOPRIM domain
MRGELYMFYKNLHTQLFNADGGNGGGDQNQNNNNDNQDGNQSSTNSQQNENMIPYSRFKEVNDNYKTVKDQLDKLIKDKETEVEESKKKQGEFESLYNDLKTKHEPLSQQFQQYQETFQAILKTKLESVPKEFHDLIPQGSELNQLQWIENAFAKGLFNKSSQSFGNQGSNPNNNDTTTITKEDFMKLSYTERVKLAKEKPEIYKKLTN